MKPEKAFGKVLREIRIEKMISQERLGLESDYHRTYISLLERGQRSPTLTTVFYLAKVLNVKASEIIKRVEANMNLDSIRPERRRK